MNIDFNVEMTFQERLAASMGIEQYRFILENAYKVNIAEDEVLHRIKYWNH